ncbi:hypothetical protein FIC87_03315 [Eggerthella lenta]|uniref:Uncharacterized protein n=1 Tax=Eggerthella lenta TaxID=84112 RepID=A0A5C5C7A8_EGGLN|nr:hypothetical protein [Eggerthella lenta]TNU94055.1 hypothetical protein FIC87_03315 [Eggerthella lenta]
MELNISAESRFLDWDYDYGYMWQDEFFWGGQFFPSYSDAQLRAMFAKAGKDMDIYVDAISKLLVNESLWDDGSEESSSRIEHALCSPVYDILALGAAYSSGWPVDYRDGLLEFCGESAYAENITLNSFPEIFACAARLLFPSLSCAEGESCSQRALELFETEGRWPAFEGREAEAWEELERFAALAYTVGNFSCWPLLRCDRRDEAPCPDAQRPGECWRACRGDWRGGWRAYGDLALAWLERSRDFCLWASKEDDPGGMLEFPHYVMLAKLGVYCMDDELVERCLEGMRMDGANPAHVVQVYPHFEDACEPPARKLGVVPFWEGRKLEDPDSCEPQDIDQLISLLKAVNMRIEVRGRLLTAYYKVEQAGRAAREERERAESQGRKV